MSPEDFPAYSAPPNKLRHILSPAWLPTFDRWFGLAYVRMALYTCLTMLALIVLIDSLENFDKFSRFAQNHQKTTEAMVWILAQHYLAFAPSLLCQHLIVIIPLAAAAIVATQAGLNRELTLLRAAGISLQRSALPLLVLALVFGVVYFAVRDTFVPLLLRKSFVMSNQLRPADILPLTWAQRTGNLQQHISIGYYDAHEGAAYNVSIEERDLNEYDVNKNNSITYQARKAFLQDHINIDNPDNEFDKQWAPDTLQPTKRSIYRHHKYTNSAWAEPVPTLLRPAHLERQVLTDMVMTWSDLLRARDDLDMKIEISRRLAEPLNALALLLVVLPLILRVSAKGGNVSYINNAIICVIAYGIFFVINVAGFSLGAKNILSPYFAAQIANLVFFTFGIFLMSRLER